MVFVGRIPCCARDVLVPHEYHQSLIMASNRETKQKQGDILAVGDIISTSEHFTSLRAVNKSCPYSLILFALVDTFIEKGKAGEKGLLG